MEQQEHPHFSARVQPRDCSLLQNLSVSRKQQQGRTEPFTPGTSTRTMLRGCLSTTGMLLTHGKAAELRAAQLHRRSASTHVLTWC